MLERKTVVILLIALVAISGFVYWGLQAEKPPTDDPHATVYYYGEGCPHCKVVNEFLTANNIAEKVAFEKKEVWANKTNASEMARRAKVCSIAPEGMGVPFVYADGICLIGEPDVKKFFTEKAGLNAE
jgi:glutaredoxin